MSDHYFENETTNEDRRRMDEQNKKGSEVQIREAALPISPEKIASSIKPSAIDTSDFKGLLGKHETERGAQAVVELMKTGDTWREFSNEEISPADLQHLFNGGWVFRIKDGRTGADFEPRLKGAFIVTKKFVDRCGQKAR